MTGRAKRREADRARRIAQTMGEADVRQGLLAYAAELEAQADELETRVRQLRLKSNHNSKVDKDKK